MAVVFPAMGEERRTYNGPALFSHGFRPFFLFGTLFAALAVPTWMAAYSHGYVFAAGGDTLSWHIHEMIYGYLAAIVAGFLMAAIPNWTGRLPVMGLPLILLFLVWLSGRMLMFVGNMGIVGPIVDCLFLVLMAGFAWREVLRSKNWRNVPVCVLVSLFALSNIIFHTEAVLGLPYHIGLRLGLAIITILMMLIGGRVIPTFTTNWMKKQQLEPLPLTFNGFDKAVVLFSLVTLLFWVVAPNLEPLGYLFLAASVSHLARLFRWKGWRTISDPLVLVLHIAYAWIPLAFFALGWALAFPESISQAHALHVLTAGAVGQLTLAVMTRATLGHCGRELKAGTGTVIIYLLIFAGAMLRFLLPFTSMNYAFAMSLAGVFWSAGFLLYAILYGPMLVRPRL